MFFSTIKKCNDDRVIKTGLDAITEFRRAGVGVIAFACCFVKGTLVISFGYDIPYPENMQTASLSGTDKLIVGIFLFPILPLIPFAGHLWIPVVKKIQKKVKKSRVLDTGFCGTCRYFW